MKKRYEGLAVAFQIAAVVAVVLGSVAGVRVALSPLRDLWISLLLILAGLLTALLLSAIAAVIDLLARIEVNTYETAEHFRQRTAAQTSVQLDQTAASPPTRNSQD